MLFCNFINNNDLVSFQNGVDTIVDGCITYGSTPTDDTPDAIVSSIGKIYTNQYNSGYSTGDTAGYNRGLSLGKGNLGIYSKNRVYWCTGEEDDDNAYPFNSISVTVPTNSTCYIIATVSNHPEHGSAFTSNCSLTLNSLSCNGASISTIYEQVQNGMCITRVYKLTTGSNSSASISASAGYYYRKYIDLRLICLG